MNHESEKRAHDDGDCSGRQLPAFAAAPTKFSLLP